MTSIGLTQTDGGMIEYVELTNGVISKDRLVNGIVYSPDPLVAERKLTEIADRLGSRVAKSRYGMFVTSDTEYWKWGNTRGVLRGLKATHAFVDERCTLKDYYYEILPGFIGKKEDLKTFE